uniref:Uncharacterized protein n=1 Tax=Arundo donax TaxID=35708 RepID=A0A0A9G7U9_ARUDO
MSPRAGSALNGSWALMRSEGWREGSWA